MPTQEEINDNTFVVISSNSEDEENEKSGNNKGFFGKFKNTFKNIREG